VNLKKIDLNIGWGILLIVLGLLFGLQSLGLVGTGTLWGWVWAFIFGAGGLVFLYWFLSDREQWWAVIPGFKLLGLGALVALGSTGLRLAGELGGALFMGSIAAAFWVVYLRNRAAWWAIIPGGVLATLALVILASNLVSGEAVGGLFFLGMAATFGLVYLFANPERRMTWALIPGAILGVMGLLLLAASSSLLGYLWPLALIGVGGYLVLRVLMRRAE